MSFKVLAPSLLAISLFLSSCGAPVGPMASPRSPQMLQAQGLIFKDPPPGWGSLSQIAATYVDLQDVQGNRDGIWENETDAPGTVRGIGTTLPLKPWVDKKSLHLKGRHAETQIAALNQFMAQQQTRWTGPLTSLQPQELKNFELFKAQKALMLSRLQRTPQEITEGFIRAQGSVMGQAIAPRKLFWQRFRPTVTPRGKMVLISPGFQETGRNFLDQIHRMNQQGYDVVVMDHQWAGYSEGSPGGLDRGFGVARDVAAMAAFVQQEMLVRDYGQNPNSELILFGNSMGGGPGVLGALTLNDQNQIQLSGPAMPKGLNAVLQAPFLESTPSLLNRLLGLFSKIPLANTLKLFSSGLPVLTFDKTAAQKGVQVILMEDIRAQLKTMNAANRDVKTLKDMIARGQGPTGKLAIVHGNQDPLASPAQSQWLAQTLGAPLKLIESRNHVLEQSPQELHYGVDMLNQLNTF